MAPRAERRSRVGKPIKPRVRPGSLDSRYDRQKEAAEVTYPEHGATRGALPPGYRHVSRRDRIGTGRAVFRKAVDTLYGWQMHCGAGLAVVWAPPTARLGSAVVMRLGPPVIGFVVPCRVMHVVDEPTRCGFAYGALPGHPECGEEALIVTVNSDDDVDLVIRAFSRPATALVRAAGPLGRAFRDLVTERYVRYLRRLTQ